MSEHDVDDIAFLTGSPHESGFLVSKRAMYEPGSVMVCSQKRACFAVSFGFLAILAVAVIVAFTKPGCPEARYIGEPVLGFHGGGRKSSVSKPIATNGEEFPWTAVKLPSYVQPLYYSLFIYPNFTTTLVKGNVSIIITAVEETKFIVLHIRDLNISHYSLQDKYKQRVSITKLLNYPEHQQIYIGLSNILHRGSNYSLNLIFESTLQERLDGFYLSSYKDKEGHQRYLAATHFEPSSARAAFPCFDEPQFKARFQLSIVREPDMFSLFNMPQRSSSSFQDTELIVDEFYETVEMSTYLVAFIVCDYSRVTNTTKDGMNVSIYAPYTMISQANYALQVSINILEYYEDFFGVAYTLPKLDLIAIPNFGPGAMENWGLIMYKETYLMYEPEHTSSRAQQKITMVIAHELAHQWFGNLVTMDWWIDLWLNEGFASFMENIGTEVAEPGWAMPEQFIVEKVQPALALDALITSHPISVPVHNPADIESIFDTVSYKKGASIISMLEVCVGRKILHSGLRNFLNDHRFSTADTVHLWRALNKAAEEENSPLNVEAIMDTWTLQAGFPLISVKIDDVTVNATQERFLEVSENTTDPNIPLNFTLGYKWHVPLTYISSENPKDPVLIWMNTTNVAFGIPKDLTWIKFNVGQRGFYRVNYGGAGWEMLTNLLLNDPERITAADRASIIDDAFTLVRGGRIHAKIALDLSLYLRNETAYAPWHTALSHFQDWVQLMFYDPTHTSMRAFIHSLIMPRYNHLGWKDTGTHLERLLRQEILWSAIECKDMKAIGIAQEMFLNWKVHNKTVPPNLRFVVYSTGVRHGMAEDWMFCWKMYNSSQVPSERKLLLRALAHSRNPWILQQYLEYTLDRNKIRPQDVMTVLIEVSGNPGGTLAAWRMIRKHWNDITRVFGTKTFSLGAIIKAVTEKFSSSFDLQEVKEFFEGKEVLPGARLIEQALETIRLHIQWLKINRDDVSHWLEKYLAKANIELYLK